MRNHPARGILYGVCLFIVAAICASPFLWQEEKRMQAENAAWEKNRQEYVQRLQTLADDANATPGDRIAAEHAIRQSRYERKPHPNR